MSFYYDLHIHTALSPCGDDDMTPNNIVNMSILKGLDVIAITDHNSARNVRACFECAKNTPLILLPGMEIETSEEVHITALFDNPDSAEKLDTIVSKNMPQIKNRTDIFGYQNIIDSRDNTVGEISNLLTVATAMSINDVFYTVNSLGGVAIPAHIDKSSYSLLSNLGFIPEDINFPVFEIKNPEKQPEIEKNHNLGTAKIIHNSDAHFLWDIHEKQHCFKEKFENGTQIINHLRG